MLLPPGDLDADYFGGIHKEHSMNQSNEHLPSTPSLPDDVHEYHIIVCPDFTNDLITAWQNQDDVLVNPQFRHCKSPEFQFCFIYAGSVRVPLGYLLAQWRNRHLVATCPQCSSDLLVYRVGAGLSFAVKTGVCVNCQQVIEVKTRFDRAFLEPVLSPLPSAFQSEITRHAAEASKKKGKTIYSGPSIMPLEDYGSIPLHAVSQLIRTGQAFDPIHTADGCIVGQFNWSDNTWSEAGKPDKIHVDKMIIETEKSYEIEITNDVVYIKEKDRSYLPRRYRLDRDRLLSYPELHVMATFKPGLPWQLVVGVPEKR